MEDLKHYKKDIGEQEPRHGKRMKKLINETIEVGEVQSHENVRNQRIVFPQIRTLVAEFIAILKLPKEEK